MATSRSLPPVSLRRTSAPSSRSSLPCARWCAEEVRVRRGRAEDRLRQCALSARRSGRAIGKGRLGIDPPNSITPALRRARIGLSPEGVVDPCRTAGRLTGGFLLSHVGGLSGSTGTTAGLESALTRSFRRCLPDMPMFLRGPVHVRAKRPGVRHHRHIPP